MMALRERLQSGDVWVEGSRAFRAFDDFLLPRDAFATPESRRAGPRRRRSFRKLARRKDKASGNPPSRGRRGRRRRRIARGLAHRGRPIDQSYSQERERSCGQAHSPALRHAAASAHHRTFRGSPRLDGLRRSFRASAHGRATGRYASLDDAPCSRTPPISGSRAWPAAPERSVIPGCCGSPNGMCATRPITRRGGGSSLSRAQRYELITSLNALGFCIGAPGSEQGLCPRPRGCCPRLQGGVVRVAVLDSAPGLVDYPREASGECDHGPRRLAARARAWPI